MENELRHSKDDLSAANTRANELESDISQYENLIVQVSEKRKQITLDYKSTVYLNGSCINNIGNLIAKFGEYKETLGVSKEKIAFHQATYNSQKEKYNEMKQELSDKIKNIPQS